ncbi:MAG: CBS domain-containing protein [Pseudomonadota bacterium]|nr:CBS domain-containing protein [Pseudomonadota bacterium]
MSLRDLAIATTLAAPGMLVSDLVRECVRVQMPGIPFRDASGRITGKASIRHILKMTCLPDYLIQHSHMLGDGIEHLRLPEIHGREILSRTIDDFILPGLPRVNSSAPVSKALAIMEKEDTTYIFILDGDEYHGAISIMSLAQHLLTEAARP